MLAIALIIALGPPHIMQEAHAAEPVSTVGEERLGGQRRIHVDLGTSTEDLSGSGKRPRRAVDNSTQAFGSVTLAIGMFFDS